MSNKDLRGTTYVYQETDKGKEKGSDELDSERNVGGEQTEERGKRSAESDMGTGGGKMEW